MTSDAQAGALHSYPELSPAAFRHALGRFVTGVTVMTTCLPSGVRAGVTVSSFNTLSLDPPLILWSLALKTPSLPVFLESGYFAVNILASDQSELALQFARHAPDKFVDVRISDGLHGVPLIEGAVAHLQCRMQQRLQGGDHELIIGRILKADVHERAPLVYGQGRFGRFSVADPSRRQA
jgi:flavin reductase (DIM6/NTAB) family NADH-FMN oxidoreductase RutF